MGLLVAIGALSLVAWLYLTFGHGRFWQADQRLDDRDPPPDRWPSVVAVVPARNEADVVARTVASLLDQDYAGPFRVVLADDESEDGTAAVARATADAHPTGGRLLVEPTASRPAGWVGKMWALHTGVRRAEREAPHAEYWWLTDADVEHDAGTLRRLVARAEARGLDLTSLMVKLHAEHGWERLLVPAFVYFFQKLFPFPKVNDLFDRTAAAAGGCVLVRCDALKRAGGIESLKGEVIDDCALAAAIARGGPIWLGLSEVERSIRPYDGLRGVWEMVARSAYTQLRQSPLLLAGTLVGLALLYLAPPLLLLTAPLHGSAVAAACGAAAWLAMAITFVPTLTLYGRPPAWGFALPLAGTLYAAMTLDSARRHWLARGAEWKGRTGAGA